MKFEDDKIVFSSGRTAYANRGIVGLSEPDEGGWQISEGYDGGLWHTGSDDWREEGDPNKLSPDDLRELADHMIDMWQRFKVSIA